MMARYFLAAIAILLLGVPGGNAQTPGRAEVISGVIDDVIVGGYRRLADAAHAQEQAVAALCSAPSGAAVTGARDAFATTVRAWSRVEMFRFGPARSEYRFERIFYWPDRKGRGLRQVQGLLAEEDDTATAVETLQQKSVAVQGLPALEFVLFGTGSGDLLQAGNYRCRYAQAIAGAIAELSEELHAAWRDDSGHGALMRNPGEDNRLYKDEDEVLQALVQAAREQLQVMRDIKIVTSIGDAPDDAHPKRAPFWRSNDTIASLRANLDGVAELFTGHLDRLLGDDPSSIANGLMFELSQADAALAELEESGRPWEEIVTNPRTHGRLTYVLIPLHGAFEIVAERYAAEIGLILGFNSLDGD